MSLLDSWTRGSHTADGRTHDTYRKGTGPGVVLIHELPGITPDVIELADEVVAAEHTVVMPHLFGRPEEPPGAVAMMRSFGQACVSREFTMLALRRTSPIAGWLRSLARQLHAECGGPGVGALGMCLTGGFALAMMVDESVAAPVVAQPSLPFPLGRARSADVNLDDDDVEAVRERARAGCSVLGVRYSGDPATGTRFDTLRRGLGENFLPLELEGRGHATLTEHRNQEAVDRVLAFFAERLR
jgi:dienelactone hydrolase